MIDVMSLSKLLGREIDGCCEMAIDSTTTLSINIIRGNMVVI